MVASRFEVFINTVSAQRRPGGKLGEGEMQKRDLLERKQKHEGGGRTVSVVMSPLL